MDKRTPFRASLIAAALASVAGFAAAQGFVTDSRGAAVVNSTGNCVRGTGSNLGECIPAPSDRIAPVALNERAESPVVDERADIAAMTPSTATTVSPIGSGLVSDSSGDVVRSGMGDCVMPGTGASTSGLPECGAVIVQAPVAPPAAEAPREIPMQRVSLDADTTFNFDSAELTDQGKEQLADIVEASEDVERLRIHITGYADRIGPEEYNLGLSQERADSVRDYLVSEGIPSEVISIEGRGETNPVVQCEGMTGVALVECLRPNRRSEVEFAALERGEEPAAEQPSQQQPWAPGTDTGTPR